MHPVIRSTVRALTACGLLLSTAAGASAADLNPRNEPRPQKDFKIEASGVYSWAVVDAAGNLVRKLNAKSVTHLGTGTYEVDFSSNITKCAATGQIANPDNSSNFATPPAITLVGRSGNPKGLFVQTWSSSSAAADEPFTVVINC